MCLEGNAAAFERPTWRRTHHGWTWTNCLQTTAVHERFPAWQQDARRSRGLPWVDHFWCARLKLSWLCCTSLSAHNWTQAAVPKEQSFVRQRLLKLKQRGTVEEDSNEILVVAGRLKELDLLIYFLNGLNVEVARAVWKIEMRDFNDMIRTATTYARGSLVLNGPCAIVIDSAQALTTQPPSLPLPTQQPLRPYSAPGQQVKHLDNPIVQSARTLRARIACLYWNNKSHNERECRKGIRRILAATVTI